MKITLYNNHSENNNINKTLVKIVDLEGYLREQTSLINPQIMIEFHPDNFKDLDYVIDNNLRYVTYNGIKIIWDTFINDYVLSANYVYIPDFNRYYFINDITSVRQNLWRLTLHVDVLMSYKNEIKNTNAFVSRNQFKYDVMVKDDLLTYYYDKDVTEEICEKGSLVNTTFNTKKTHTRNVVLSCVSFMSIPSGTPITHPSGTNLPDINQLEYNEYFSETCFIMNSNEISIVAYRALEHDSWASYIKAITIYPFDFEYQGLETNKNIVYLGEHAIKTLNQQTEEYLECYWIKYKVSNYYVIADFKITGDSFLDYEPYTMYELFIPYCSWVKLNPDQVLNHRLIVYYTIQVEDGSANAYVYDVTDNKLIYTSTCQLGVRIGITATNNEEISASRKANNLNLTLGLVSSVASIGIGAYTGNATAVVGGVLSGAKSITSFVNNNSQLFDRAQATFGNGNSGMYSSQECILRKTRLKPKNYNDDFSKIFGKPLNSFEKLGDLSGYTIVEDEHLENFGSSTKSESDEIKTILKTGVIL